MAKVTVQAIVDLESFIKTIDAVPGMIELPFSVALVCKFTGGEIVCETSAQVKELAEGILKKRLSERVK